ncbi:hypothetical protein F442_02468 [Phytophthora nicotianae P10297]|uniref:Uncharacterized protein n=1 Tax=Phytophthora nicotianae P10297 TaxID=1317064 RepID=W2ZYU2_PHYNI|nr:hypothetical protein F442_02468 [Phytophthora nicotianae P10297]
MNNDVRRLRNWTMKRGTLLRICWIAMMNPQLRRSAKTERHHSLFIRWTKNHYLLKRKCG